MTGAGRIHLPTSLRFPEPASLSRAERRLSETVAAVLGERTGSSDLRAATEWLKKLPAQPEQVPEGRRLIRALLTLLPHMKNEGQRSGAARSILRSPALTARLAWRLWQQEENTREESAVWLAQRLLLLDKRGRSRPRWLPDWVGTGRRETVVNLRRPEVAMRKWCRAREPALGDAAAQLGCSVQMDFVRGALVDLIEVGSERWWRAHDAGWLRTWATEAEPGLRVAVADRMLRSFAGSARGPQYLPRGDEAVVLQKWLRGLFGDPRQQPGKWEDFSERARTVAVWLIVRRQFDQILATFQRNSAPERVAFWSQYLPALRDARFYEAKDGPVCLMLLGDLLVVEFGRVGNACYLYSAPQSETPGGIVGTRIPRDLRCDDFKQVQTGLRLGRTRFPFVDKLDHRGFWQGRYPQWVGYPPRV